MGCAIGTIRYIIFFFNFLLALTGLAILIIGVVILNAGDITAEFTAEIVHYPALIFTIVGAIVFIFAFFGCWGAIRESQCMISTYAVLLLTLFLLQVGTAILAYSYESDAEEAVGKFINTTYSNYNKNMQSKDTVDELQQRLHCCGTTDFHTPWDQMSMSAPDSCFPNNNRKNAQFHTGCLKDIIANAEILLKRVGRVALFTGIGEVVGIVFSLCLANSIRRSEIRGYA